jgi:hypothetical protein
MTKPPSSTPPHHSPSAGSGYAEEKACFSCLAAGQRRQARTPEQPGAATRAEQQPHTGIQLRAAEHCLPQLDQHLSAALRFTVDFDRVELQ